MNQPQDEAYRYVPLFESWQIDEKIGEGSYGVVYKVSKREMGETYDSAMKVITVPTKEQYREVESSFGGDERAMTEYFEDIVKNIVREIKMLYSLGGNANIIGYQDHKVVKKQDGLGWEILIRMEYVTSLRKYQKEHSMTREDVMRLGIDICSALETCSKKGIVHRDIKDDNIFVSDDGVFKLGDFGIARELSKSGRAASMRGTPLYMAPEIYRGDKYDAVVDIYSLGIVLYKMLNYGRMPLTPPYPEKMRYQDSEDALELRMSGASLPNPANAEGVLADIVLRACAYSVQDRYASPAVMKADMLRALASMGEVQKQQVVLFATEKGEADLGTSTSTSEEKAKNDGTMAGGTIGSPVDQALDGASGDKPPKHDSTIGFPPVIDITSTAETHSAEPKEKSNTNVLIFEGEKHKAKKSIAGKIAVYVIAVLAIVAFIFILKKILTANGSNNGTPLSATDNNQTVPAKTLNIAMISATNNADDMSYSQNTWLGYSWWAGDHGVTASRYIATEDSDEARAQAITDAIKEGANLIICPGYQFSLACQQLPQQYPEVIFLGIDISAVDVPNLQKNVALLTYQEEQAGFLAGYAAVMDGYTQLAFLGGMEIPAVVRYGYGFVQGANQAAIERGNSSRVSIKYWYSGSFSPNDVIARKTADWYAEGTQVVFACGGGIVYSAIYSAEAVNGKVIGVDFDQVALSESIITSAKKDIANSLYLILTNIQANGGVLPANYAGTESKLGANYYCVGLPTDAGSWRFQSFTVDQYNSLYENIRSGVYFVSSDINVRPAVDVNVDYQK